MRSVIYALLLSLPALPAFAEGASSDEVDEDESVLSFTLENDLPANTDQYYTNGFRLTWTSEVNDVPYAVRQGAEPLLNTGGKLRWQATFGQNLYTPQDIKLEDPPEDDQPYAAWLYGSVGVISDEPAEGDRFSGMQTSALLSLGVVGPAALGEPVQDFVHDLIGSPDPQGWDHQLHNEPAVLLMLQRRWVFGAPLANYGGLRVDAAPHGTIALGNVFTHGAAGLTFRFGDPPEGDYGPPRIQPASPGSGYFGPVVGGDTLGWYVFAGAEGRAVARNIFLDGNTFEDSPSVDKKIFVGDLSAGFVVTYDDFRIAYTHVLRTPEFEGQSGPSVFGGITVGWRF
ncbi:MAG: lipid A deacylase LpxR family protein [Thalassobaculaceae bacterium]|nr:lipid A deacylase LpxR family protein [Thalassobaculaceae bacterium]